VRAKSQGGARQAPTCAGGPAEAVPRSHPPRYDCVLFCIAIGGPLLFNLHPVARLLVVLAEWKCLKMTPPVASRLITSSRTVLRFYG
jgi:hypothetical protein